MGNTRYQLTDTNHDKIAAKLLFVSSSVYEGDWPSIQHTHYFTELFYVRGGSGKFIVEDKTFSVTQDDLVIINPNVEHTEGSLGTVPLEYVVQMCIRDSPETVRKPGRSPPGRAVSMGLFLI